MLIQMTNGDGDNLALIDVGNNYTLDKAEKIIKEKMIQAEKNADDCFEDDDCDDIYTMDEFEALLPPDMCRVYTEIIHCKLSF